MQGRVIEFERDAGVGVVRTSNGDRLRFSTSDALSAGGLAVGAEVDFVQAGEAAVQIVVLSAPAPSPALDRRGRDAAFEPAPPAGSFFSYFRLAMTRRYLDFQGRARRREYWSMIVFSWVVVGPLYLAGVLIGGRGAASSELAETASTVLFVLAGLATAAFALPTLAVGVRRMHDTGRSGWACLIAVLPYIGSLWFLVLVCLPGQPRRNAYGPRPA